MMLLANMWACIYSSICVIAGPALQPVRQNGWVKRCGGCGIKKLVFFFFYFRLVEVRADGETGKTLCFLGELFSILLQHNWVENHMTLF